MQTKQGVTVQRVKSQRMGHCEICNRPMGMEWRMSGAQRWRCSRECRQARTPRPTYEQACTICGATFTARRDDAETCSSACRQKAYRQRRAAGRDFTSPTSGYQLDPAIIADIDALARTDDLDAARSKLLAALVRRPVGRTRRIAASPGVS